MAQRYGRSIHSTPSLAIWLLLVCINKSPWCTNERMNGVHEWTADERERLCIFRLVHLLSVLFTRIIITKCVYLCVCPLLPSQMHDSITHNNKKRPNTDFHQNWTNARARVSCGFWRERVALMATNRVRINIKYTFGVRIFAICVFCVLRFGKQNLRLTNWLGLVRFAHTSEPFCARWMDTTACYFPLSNNTINSATNFT